MLHALTQVPQRRRRTLLSCGGGLAVAGFAIAVTLLSLVGPAPSPTVPPADAQSRTYHPEIEIEGFNDVRDFERAHEGVDLVVTYRRRSTSVPECGTHSETFRISASGIPQLHGDRASLFQSVNTADGRTVACVYNVLWPAVTGFGKPDDTMEVDSFDRAKVGSYSPPTYFPGFPGVDIDQTQELVENVQERLGNTPDWVILYRFAVRPTASSPAGCDANTRNLMETTLHFTITPARDANSEFFEFTGREPIILRPHGAMADCVYEAEFRGVADPSGRYIGDHYILDDTYARHRTQIANDSNQEVARFRATVNDNPSSFTPLEIELDLTNAVPRVLRDTTFEVNYRHTSTSPMACQDLPEPHDDWRITDRGAVRRTRPARIEAVTDAPDTECEYEVVWPDLEGLVTPTTNTIVKPVEGSNAATGVYALDLAAAAAGTVVHEIEIDFPFRDIDDDGVNDYSPQFEVQARKRQDYGPGDDCPASLYVTASTASGVGQQEIRNARLPGMHADCKLAFDFPLDVESGVPGISFHLNRQGRFGTGGNVEALYDRFTGPTDDGNADLDAVASYGDGSYVVPINTSITLDGEVPQEARNKTYRVSFEPRVSSIEDVCRGRPDEDWEDWRIDADGNITRVGEAKVRLMGRAARMGSNEGADCQPYTIVWPEISGLAKPRTRTLSLSDRDYAGKSLSATYTGTTYYHHNYDAASDTGDVVAVWLNRAEPPSLPAQPEDIFETFTVRIRPTSGSPPGCDANYNDPEETERTLSLRLNQRHDQRTLHPVSTRDGNERLVLRPMGQTRDCEYEVRFPPTEDGPSDFYVRTGDHTVTIRPGGGQTNGLATGVYSANPSPSSAASEFRGSFQLETQDVVTADTTFGVEVVPGAAPEDCTPRMELPISVKAGKRTTTATVKLILRPAPDAEYCSYTVNWPEREVTGPFHSMVATFSEGTMLGGAVQTVSNLYEHDATLSSLLTAFDGTVQVSATQNVTQDAIFAVAIVPPGSPVGCSERSDLMVTVAASSQSSTLSVPGLVHQPSGTGPGCSYTVRWTPRDASGMAWTEDSTFTKGEVLSESTSTAANRYEPIAPGGTPPDLNRPFTGEIEVLTVTAVHADTTFAVEVVPPSYSPAGCTGKQTVLVIVAQNTNSQIAQVPDELVLDVAGADDGTHSECSYAVRWPSTETGTNHYIEDTAYADADLWLEGSHPRATNRYKPNPQSPPPPPSMDTPFAPAVSVSVPPLEGLTAGANLFSGASIGVTVERDASASNDCSLGTQLSVPFTVDAQGATSQTALPASLFGTLADGSSCSYTVAFPPISSTSGAELTWTLTSDMATATLSQSSPSVMATYAVGNVTFAPDATIGAPAGHGGAQVTAMFASSGVGCVDATLTYELQADGSVEPAAGNEALVAYPAGATAASALCSYDVTFSATELNGTALALQANPSTTVTGLNHAIAAEYQVAPAGGDNGNGGNGGAPSNGGGTQPGNGAPPVGGGQEPMQATTFDGSIEVRTTEAVAVTTRFDVDVDPPAAPLDCSAMQTVEVTIAVGATSATVSVPGLIREPVGASDECVYTVSWRRNEHGGTAMWEIDGSYPDASSELSNDNLSVSNRYQPSTPADPSVNPGNTNQPVTPTTPTGGAPRPASTGGRTSGGGGGGSRGGGSSGGSSGGGAATGPWQVVASSRVPVAVSVVTQEAALPAAAVLEVMLSVPGTCGEEVDSFAGLPANIGLVYALMAQPGATVEVLTDNALRLPSHAARGDQTRGCELRVTLLTAPEGCRLQSADGVVSTDEAGRSYVELTGDTDTAGFALNPSLTCG